MLNLGGVSVAEMAILTRELANTRCSVDWLIGPASLVTALDMKGFSLSAIVLEEGIEKALLSDVETAGWQTPVQPRTVNIMPSTLASARVDFTLGQPTGGRLRRAGDRHPLRP
jgi:dihydroxyacetone kinase